MLHDLFGRGGLHALDEAGGQKAFDAAECGGLDNFKGSNLQLTAVLGMIDIGAGQDHLFTDRQLRKNACAGDGFPACFDHDHGIAVFLVPEDSAGHGTFQSFCFHKPHLPSRQALADYIRKRRACEQERQAKDRPFQKENLTNTVRNWHNRAGGIFAFFICFYSAVLRDKGGNIIVRIQS